MTQSNSFPKAVWGGIEASFLPYEENLTSGAQFGAPSFSSESCSAESCSTASDSSEAFSSGSYSSESFYAAMVFAFADGRCAIADIQGRGWCIPGGRLEQGETSEAAARREAYEEAGLTVGPLTPLGHYSLVGQDDMDRDQRGDRSVAVPPLGGSRLAIVYRAPILARAPLPSGTESRGVRFATLDELPALYYLWDPLVAAVCRYAFASSLAPSS